MSRASLAVVLLAGCGASLGPGGDNSDANTDGQARDAAVDARPDARPCTGGNAAAVAPDGSCLVLVTTPQTYLVAKNGCTAMDAHLAYLKSAAVDAFAEDFVGTNNTWIGGSDRVTEGTFLWEDGTAFVYTNWNIDEPNNGGGTYQEDCAIIAGMRVDKKWDDRPCDPSEIPTSGSFAYLCQY